MNRTHITLATIALIVLIGGCVLQDETESSANLAAPVFTISEETLWVQPSDNTQSYALISEGQDFAPVLSPDGKWLAVEVQVLSNLRILRVFKEAESGFEETSTQAAARLWDMAEEKDSVDKDSIRNARINLLGWRADSKMINVELAGILLDGTAYQRVFELEVSEL